MCPAEGKTCNKCGRRNHFAKMCRSRVTLTDAVRHKPMPNTTNNRIATSKQRQQKVDTVEHESSSEESVFIDTLQSNTSEDRDEKEWLVDLTIEEEKVINFKLDTGAHCNVISSSVLKSLKNVRMKRSRMHLITYSGHKIQPVGQCLLLCEYQSRYYTLTFQVIEGTSKPLLGLTACTALGLIKRVDVVDSELQAKVQEKYKDVFTGLGCLHGKVSLKVKPGSTPVVHPPRKVPIALQKDVKDELKRMEEIGVIERVTEPTEWVSSMVTVIKPDRKRVRICLDPKDLNEALERAHYPMKTIEEIVTKLPQAKVFSTLDANCGYWQLELDTDSSKLCTFNTPMGRYRYKRLPFGVNAAPEIFQRCMTELFDDLTGVEVIMDDILVWGSNEQEHDMRLEQVLQRCRDKKLKLNLDKCKFKVDEVPYIGHILTSDGVKPDLRR
ncbi:hypothetical protein BSL78_23064 [Apostichopus japonicus]|uniref:Reverse transcriptase domain-containing protein n=1 Tax=Stichopus japonicus TaxID=307972 RepID=A0A2G8JWH2_STIJA|nr:hypothetical protein BSL78_23064 [Apostichopus japonicus]